MPLVVADLVALLRVDDSGFEKGMASGEATAKKSHAWLGALATGAKVVGGALLGAGIAGATMGLKTAAGLQNADIAFTTMLGSAEKAHAFLGQLADFAAKTPFEFPELQTAASSLISVGISADKVIPIMRTLGDTTAGMGTGAEGIKRATIALQQMNAAGKITGEDLNQLRDAGVPVFDLLAAATGKSKAEVVDLAKAGKLGAKELGQLMDALEHGKGLERFGGLMEKQAQTLTGAWSTLHDTLNMDLAQMVQPFVPIITKLLPAGAAKMHAAFLVLNPKIAEGVAWFEKATAAGGVLRGKFDSLTVGARNAKRYFGVFFDTLRSGNGEVGEVTNTYSAFYQAGTRLRIAYDKVAAAIGPVIEKFRAADDAAGPHASLLERIGAALANIDWDAVGDQAAEVGEDVAKLGPVFQAFADQMPGLGDLLHIAGDMLGFFADHAGLLVKLMPLIVAGVLLWKAAELAANVARSAAVVMKIIEVKANRALAASVRELAAAQRAGLAPQQLAAVATGESTVATEANTAATNTGRLAQIRSAVATAAKAAAEKVAAGASKVMAGAQWLLNAAMSANPIALVIVGLVALGAALVVAWKKSETFRSIVKGVFGFLKDHIAVIATVLFGPIGLAVVELIKHWDKVKAATEAVFGWVKGFIGGVFDAISAIFGKLVDYIKDWVRFFSDLFHGDWSAVWSDLKQIASDAIDLLITFVKEVPGRILSALASLAGLLGDLASKAWHTFWDTATGVWDKIIDWVTGLPQAVWDGMVALGGLLTDLATSAWNGFWDTAKTVWSSIFEWVKTLPQQFLGGLQVIGQLLKDLATSAWTGFWESAKSVWSTVIGWVTGLPQAVWDGMSSLAGKLGGVASDAFGAFLASAKELWGDVSGWLSGLPGMVLNFFASLPMQMLGIGKKVMQNLWDGLVAVWQKLKEWFLGILDWLSGLWPGSPVKHGPLRKRGMYRGGAGIMEQLADGMRSQADLVKRAGLDVLGGLDVAALPAPRINRPVLAGGTADRLERIIAQATTRGGDGGAIGGSRDIHVHLTQHYPQAVDASTAAAMIADEIRYAGAVRGD